jgi:hypothetical protein
MITNIDPQPIQWARYMSYKLKMLLERSMSLSMCLPKIIRARNHTFRFPNSCQEPSFDLPIALS